MSTTSKSNNTRRHAAASAMYSARSEAEAIRFAIDLLTAVVRSRDEHAKWDETRGNLRWRRRNA